MLLLLLLPPALRQCSSRVRGALLCSLQSSSSRAASSAQHMLSQRSAALALAQALADMLLAQSRLLGAVRARRALGSLPRR